MFQNTATMQLLLLYFMKIIRHISNGCIFLMDNEIDFVHFPINCRKTDADLD
jgi:hypothetical protein